MYEFYRVCKKFLQVWDEEESREIKVQMWLERLLQFEIPPIMQEAVKKLRIRAKKYGIDHDRFALAVLSFDQVFSQWAKKYQSRLEIHQLRHLLSLAYPFVSNHLKEHRKIVNTDDPKYITATMQSAIDGTTISSNAAINELQKFHRLVALQDKAIKALEERKRNKYEKKIAAIKKDLMYGYAQKRND